MSRRRKAWLFAGTALVMVAAVLFWPRPNWAAREALAEWRGLVEVDDAPPPMEAEPIRQPDLLFEVEVRVVKLCLNDATAGLFATPGQSGKVLRGKMRSFADADRLIHRLQDLEVLTVVCGWQFLTQSGQWVKSSRGGEIPVLPPNGTITNRLIGNSVELHSDFTRDGELWCATSFEVTRLADEGATDTPPKIDTATTGKIAARLRPGEALLIAGLTQHDKAPKVLKAPLLCELPGVGGWFTWSYTRHVEEEWIVLITHSGKRRLETP
jgi:hypothetical protein